jgi:hypothetical protein
MFKNGELIASVNPTVGEKAGMLDVTGDNTPQGQGRGMGGGGGGGRGMGGGR